MEIVRSSKGDPDVRAWMAVHYSAPKGFVGRQLVYKVFHEGVCYGAIVAGSATRFLPGRTEFFGEELPLNNLVNNTFFHVEKQGGDYPIRNFTTAVIRLWRETVLVDWSKQYGDAVLGWETLIELPRTGECYRRDGWVQSGVTKGFTCKRTAGKGSDSWSGRRVWDMQNLRPKAVFLRKV